MKYHLYGLKIYRGVELIATAANPASARVLLDALNSNDGYPERVLCKLQEQA